MNELFALDPDTVSDQKDLMLMMNHFGFSKGKFVCKFPNTWTDKVLQHYKDVERYKVLELLHKYNKSLYPLLISYDDKAPWIENAQTAQRTDSPFHKIISNSIKKDQIISSNAVIYDDALESLTPGKEIPRDVNEYLNALSLLIDFSTEIFLADRFFQLRKISTEKNVSGKFKFKKHKDKESFLPKHQGKWDTLRRLLKHANSSPRTTVFKIFFQEFSYKDMKIPFTRAEQEDLTKKDISKISKGLSNLDVQYEILPKTKSDKHWRYIFSIKAAIRLDAGIAFSKDPTENEIWWVDAKHIPWVINHFEPYFPKN